MQDRQGSFDRAPKVYDEGRPSYPDGVIDWIVQRTDLRPEDTLLEIGPGTGQATLKFAQRGYRVHCVERGRHLAELLLQKCKPYRVTVDVRAFEEWQPQPSFTTPFIFSANAFHWLDPQIRFRKCHALLSDSGSLALLWNLAPYDPPLPLKKAYDLLLEYSPEQGKPAQTKAEIEKEHEREIAESGYFSLADFLEFPWRLSQTRETIAKGFFSQSLFLALDEHTQQALSARITHLFQELDEINDLEAYTIVFIAKKIGASRP